MTNFVEVWFGSTSSQDMLKRRLHLPFDLEFYFLLTLRFRSVLTCANSVNAFSFLSLLWSTDWVFLS